MWRPAGQPVFHATFTEQCTQGFHSFCLTLAPPVRPALQQPEPSRPSQSSMQRPMTPRDGEKTDRFVKFLEGVGPDKNMFRCAGPTNLQCMKLFCLSVLNQA